MKYLITRLQTILLTGLFLIIYHSIGTARAIEIIDPGRVLAAQCAQCHGMEGNNDEGFEGLDGESFNEIYDELLEMFNSSKNDLMDHQAKGYITKDAEGNVDDAVLIALAEYFSGQAKTEDDDPAEEPSDSGDSEDAKDGDLGDEKDEEEDEDDDDD